MESNIELNECVANNSDLDEDNCIDNSSLYGSSASLLSSPIQRNTFLMVGEDDDYVSDGGVFERELVQQELVDDEYTENEAETDDKSMDYFIKHSQSTKIVDDDSRSPVSPFHKPESSDSETGIVGKMATPGGHSEKEDGDDDNQSVYDGSDLEAQSDVGAINENVSDKDAAVDDSDKESVADELIADIFGSSDEDEEFAGFNADEVQISKKDENKSSALMSDSNVDDGEDDDDVDLAVGLETNILRKDVVPLESDVENMHSVRRDRDEMKINSLSVVSDFDLMMKRQKEENQRMRRKRRDVDMINDNDDLIAEMIARMKQAAEEDRKWNLKRLPATHKLKLLPYVQSQLQKSDLHLVFLDHGILSALTEWLAPLPDKSLPHFNIRRTLLHVLSQFPSISSEGLKGSGIGKAVMYLYKHPREMKENRLMAGKLINEWSRPIFNLTSDLKNMSREERKKRDEEQEPKRRRTSIEGRQQERQIIGSAMQGEERALRPGDPGWIYRARVPMPSNKDYIHRPHSTVDTPLRRPLKKSVSRYEQHVRNFKEKRKYIKGQQAVTVSVEGRKMSL